MNENLHPVSDDQLEARLTAWVLGEASPFEIAELESLVAKSPELQLFLNRTRALHALLQEAETTANTPSEDWKLPAEKRDKLDEILGTVPLLIPHKESRIRRASFRAAWGIAAVFVVTFFSLRLLPRDYEAEAVIEVKPRERTIDPLGGMSHGPTMTPQFFGTEFNKIKSRNSLEKVIDDLDLTSRWNTDKETALKRLKDSVETENIRGTDLIAIRVRQPDEQEAKEITRAVTEGYRDYRNSLEEKAVEKGIAEIRKAVRQQEDKVEERRKVLTTISRTKKIIYHGEPGVTGQSDSDESGIIAQREGKLDALERSIDTTDYVDAKQDFETDLALLEQMKIKLMSEEIAADIPNDSVVIHDDPAITGKKFPSNPLASLRKAITPEAKSSSPAAPAKMAAAELSNEKIEIAGNTRTQDKVIRREVPAEPSAYFEKGAADTGLEASTGDAAVHIGGQVRTPGPQKFKEGLTLGEAVASAGGATEFGSAKRVKLYRDGKTQTYDLNDKRLAQIELQPNDTIEMPEKAVFGDADPAADKAIAAKSASPVVIPVPDVGAVVPSTDFGDGDDFGGGFASNGNRSGDRAIIRDSIDEVLNNPEGTAAPAKPTSSAPAPAAEPASEMSSLAQREIIRRQESVAEADRNLIGGRESYAKGDYGQAVEKYKEALQQLPDSPATAERRESYTEHLNDASLARAREFRKVGKYDEARELLKQAETNAPADARIKEEIAYLDDPIRTNPALTYEHQKSVEEVRRKLYMAEGNYVLGKYDDAKKAYEDTLRIDPYNKAARKGMEKIEAAKSDYYRAAYDHTRAEMLMKVDKEWELAVPADPQENVEGKAKEGADLFADSDSPDEVASPTADADFDGFANYGEPIDGKPEQVDITTKHVEITQANDEELGFDWIVSPFTQKGNISSGSVIPVTPATPTAFESDLTGVEGEVVPGLEDLPHIGHLFKIEKPTLADLSQEIPAAQEPFSTFSLNISDASFQLALAAVEKGERPDPESIKPEQFYNAVDYGDPAPSSLEPVAAAIDQTAHPVIPGRNLVRVAIRTASTGRSAAQPLRLTLLVDQSGSMARADRRAAMDTALAQLATLLTENDQVTVIGFSRTPRLIADALPGNEAAKLPDLINPTANEGGTNLEQALHLSSELALRHKLDGAQNRIVLFTDGAANLGDADPDRLAERVKELRQQGLAFDIAGIGTNDTNDRLLSELARHGNGRYYLVGENAGDSFAAQLAGAFRPAAENVKVQVKLNPERVGSYKLIGFEKDRLKTEDFRDDSVDAAELAADEAGVAIYQVETLPEGTGEIGEVSVRFRDTTSGDMVERAWTIPHEPATAAFDKAAPQTQLATLALLAAQKLQGGPLADAIRFGDHAETIAKLKQAYANDAKAQRLLTLINALR